MRQKCKTEGCNKLVKTNGRNKSGVRRYHKICSQCAKKRHKQGNITPRHKRRTAEQKRKDNLKYRRKKYNNYVKLDSCEFCGFKAKHPCQLDVDHIDGNHCNNNHSNLQTLCANCHRLKTIKNKDYENRKPQP